MQGDRHRQIAPRKLVGAFAGGGLRRCTPHNRLRASRSPTPVTPFILWPARRVLRSIPYPMHWERNRGLTPPGSPGHFGGIAALQVHPPPTTRSAIEGSQQIPSVPQLSTLNVMPHWGYDVSPPNPQPSTLNPQPSTINSSGGGRRPDRLDFHSRSRRFSLAIVCAAVVQ
jgi:hypothetical protein